MAKERIALYDALKGFAILWIVAFHIPAFGQCTAIRVYYAVPLFFVLSGIFFYATPWWEFVVKKARRLLRPFVVFYLLAYVVYMVGGSLRGGGPFGWSEPKVLLELLWVHNAEPLSPLAMNYPLWFLLVLFNISLLYYGVVQVVRSAVGRLVVGGACFGASIWLDEAGVNGLFFLSLTLRYLFYFAVGHTLVPRFVGWLNTTGRKVWVGTGALVLLVVATVVGHSGLFVVRVLLFGVMAAIVVGFLIDRVGWIRRLFVFFGTQSLVVLGLHTVVIWGFLSLGFGHGMWDGWLLWLVDCALCGLAVVVIGRTMPWILGTEDIKK